VLRLALSPVPTPTALQPPVLPAVPSLDVVLPHGLLQVLLGAAAYVVVGFVVCARVARRGWAGRDGFAPAGGRAAIAALAAIVLWPAIAGRGLLRVVRRGLGAWWLARQLARAARPRRPRGERSRALRPRAERSRRASVAGRRPFRPATAAVPGPLGTAGRAGVRDRLQEGAGELAAGVRDQAAGVYRACEDERLVDALFSSYHLHQRVAWEYGPGHAHTLEAMELLAHVYHLVGDDTRAITLYLETAALRGRGHGIDHPSAIAALRRAYAIWTTASDRTALRTGPALLPYVRLTAGEGHPATAAVTGRLTALRAASCSSGVVEFRTGRDS
jgi:hypothetical protein